MGKAVSNDLRLRMVRGIAAGKSRRSVAAQFEVAPYRAVVIEQVKAKPDITIISMSIKVPGRQKPWPSAAPGSCSCRNTPPT